MEPKFFKIPVCVGDVTLRVAKGHFATRNSHINYFIDVTRQQSCLQEAEGGLSVNAGKEIYLLRENLSSGGQLIFRDNARFMLEGKNVLLLLASITTGSTVEKGMRCIQYYGGSVSGVASIYSHLTEVEGVPVVSLFNTGDLPEYASYAPQDCPLCRQGLEVDAVVDKYGYSKL